MSQMTATDVFTGAQSWESLPTVDISGWAAKSDEEKIAAALNVIDIVTTKGFFYLSGHGIKQSKIDDVYAASKAFHHQPAAYKEQYHIKHSKHHRGWVPFSEIGQFEKDNESHQVFYESYDLSYDLDPGDARTQNGYGLVGPNIWPDLPNFRSNVKSYYDSVYSLGRDLLGIFELGLGMAQGQLLRHINAPTSQLRLLNYLENDAPADEFHHGIDAHSDFECFTILHATGPGLQLLSSQGHWVETPPVDNHFIVLIGDVLEAWSGGKLTATQHRVVNRGASRCSLPFFFGADFDCVVRPEKPFDTQSARERYPSFVAGEHLWGRTIKVFPYLRNLIDSGELKVDFEIADENPFKRISKEEEALLEQRSAT